MSIVYPKPIVAMDCRAAYNDGLRLDGVIASRMRAFAIACLMLVLAACVGRRAAAVDPTSTLCVDGVLVSGTDTTLRELLGSRVSTRRWLDGFDANAPGPLVVMDGLDMGGTEQLLLILSRDVHSVEILEPGLAMTEFGSRGRRGAIVVQTKRTGNDVPVSGTRPMRRCRLNSGQQAMVR